MDLPRDFRDLLEEFARERVEAVIVGGYAVAFHARPRATKDIDIVLGGDSTNLERASAALQRFGAPANVVTAVRTLGETEVAYMGEPPMRIDLLRTIEGVSATDLFADAVPGNLDGVPVRVISLEHLIANKRAVDREQDRLDVAILTRVAAKRSR